MIFAYDLLKDLKIVIREASLSILAILILIFHIYKSIFISYNIKI